MKTITLLTLIMLCTGCQEMNPSHTFPEQPPIVHGHAGQPIHGDQAYVEMYPDGCGE